MPEQSASRAGLRAIIAQIEETKARLATLEQAQTRAREQSWHAASNLAEVRDALERVTSDESRRLAYEFATGGELADPVADAKSRVTDAESEVNKLTEIETALAGEIDRVEASLRQLRANQYAIMSEIVTTSPQYLAVLAAHKAAWERLRSVKTVLKVVQAGLHGQLPQSFMDEASRSEPLEERVGYPIDQELVNTWAVVMAGLEHDADAELPSQV